MRVTNYKSYYIIISIFHEVIKLIIQSMTFKPVQASSVILLMLFLFIYRELFHRYTVLDRINGKGRTEVKNKGFQNRKPLKTLSRRDRI